MQKTNSRIPDYLKVYVVDQNYDLYTPRDQATWRYIMRQSRRFFETHAHPCYLEGLKKTGIPIDSIPRIDQMNRVLEQFGWGAVCVRGFIPPLAFLDFQAKQILPIAADMRTLEHIEYTPAPDIVHEAAGHAPILADADYRAYLAQYAKLARKAIYSLEDIHLYEAIRLLSDTKENPDATKAEIAQAERALEEASRAITWISEAAQVGRLYWWTAEYGLIGDIEEPLIYGAGLLSSIGESKSCLLDHVKKHPFSLSCIAKSYDITEPQPQLYVAKDFKELLNTLLQFETTMAFHVGGHEALARAKLSKTVTTTEFENGLGVSGIFDEYLRDAQDSLIFARWQGPVQLSHHESQISGHGKSQHPHGFSTPLGMWSELKKDPTMLTLQELESLGFAVNQQATLNFASGFQVRGVVKSHTFIAGHLALITWDDAFVTYNGKTFFQPDWGVFDMLVASTVTSVYGGPADWVSYGDYEIGKATSQPGRTSPYTPKETRLFDLYQQLRDLRESKRIPTTSELTELAQRIETDFCDEWLLGVELMELGTKLSELPYEQTPWEAILQRRVFHPEFVSAKVLDFIHHGIELAGD